MKLKLIDIVKLSDISRFYLKYVMLKKTMPIRVAYKFNKLFTKAEEEGDFYQKELDKLYDKYSKHDENNNPLIEEDGSIAIKDEYLSDFYHDLNNLWNLQVDWDPRITFSLDELDCGLQLTLEQANLLMPFVI